MIINLKPFTLVVLVGPSHCGKSVFAQWLLKAFLAQDPRLTGSIISSDALRMEVTGRTDLSIGDQVLEEASDAAFELLRAKLKAYMAPLTGQHLVIVDSTGLNEAFRKELSQTARLARYQSLAVVFDYSRSEYLSEQVPAHLRHSVISQAKRLKEAVLPNIKKEHFNEVLKLRKRDTEHYASASVGLELREVFDRTQLKLEAGQRLALIGDVHEQAEALSALVDQIPEDCVLVQVGDYLDKNANTEGVIEVLEKLVESRGLILVHGNHENYVAGRLQGSIDEGDADKHFSALPVLQARPDLAARFLKLWEGSRPFLRIDRPGHRTTWVTHAPCASEVVGKLTSFDLRDQRNLRVADRTEEGTQQAIAGLRTKASSQGPWRAFGHIAHRGAVRHYNQLWLDTGAAHQGGKLTAVILSDAAPLYFQVPVAKGIEDAPINLEPVVEKPEPTRAMFDLDEDEQYTLRKVLQGNVRFISGTMAPASAKGSEDIESLELGLGVFAKAGVPQVILEPKFMGSRAQVYLFKGQPEACFATSRKGHRISWVEGLPELLAELLEKFSKESDFEWEHLIIDGELMPWAALGASLIQREFLEYRDAVEGELNTLQTDEVFAQLFPENTVEDQLRHLAAFDRQLELYGKPGALRFEPFSILSIDGEDATDLNQEVVFKAISDQPCLVLDPRDSGALQAAQSFFEQLTTEKGMEGVVIKPLVPHDAAPPYLKVRNKEYLRLIYGYDYPQRLAKLCSAKNTRGKVALSISEWNLGRKMLAASKESLEGLVCAMLFDMRKERALDPRL